jgi:glutathione S-transferase
VRLHAIPFSTNVERVSLALAFKGLDAAVVQHSPDDRSAIVALSGQDLVPVLEDEGAVISDSTAILRHLEATHPSPALWPVDPARSAEAEVFVDWFNRIWKRPPNLIADGDRDPALVDELRGSLELFEALLAGRDHLLSDDFGVADTIAFPFLKYGHQGMYDPVDDEVFHRVLIDHLAFGKTHPRLAAWAERVDAMPRVS